MEQEFCQYFKWEVNIDADTLREFVLHFPPVSYFSHMTCVPLSPRLRERNLNALRNPFS